MARAPRRKTPEPCVGERRSRFRETDTGRVPPSKTNIVAADADVAVKFHESASVCCGEAGENILHVARRANHPSRDIREKRVQCVRRRSARHCIRSGSRCAGARRRRVSGRSARSAGRRSARACGSARAPRSRARSMPAPDERGVGHLGRPRRAGIVPSRTSAVDSPCQTTPIASVSANPTPPRRTSGSGRCPGVAGCFERDGRLLLVTEKILTPQSTERVSPRLESRPGCDVTRGGVHPRPSRTSPCGRSVSWRGRRRTTGSRQAPGRAVPASAAFIAGPSPRRAARVLTSGSASGSESSGSIISGPRAPAARKIGGMRKGIPSSSTYSTREPRAPEAHGEGALAGPRVGFEVAQVVHDEDRGDQQARRDRGRRAVPETVPACTK